MTTDRCDEAEVSSLVFTIHAVPLKHHKTITLCTSPHFTKCIRLHIYAYRYYELLVVEFIKPHIKFASHILVGGQCVRPSVPWFVGEEETLQ